MGKESETFDEFSETGNSDPGDTPNQSKWVRGVNLSPEIEPILRNGLLWTRGEWNRLFELRKRGLDSPRSLEDSPEHDSPPSADI